MFVYPSTGLGGSIGGGGGGGVVSTVGGDGTFVGCISSGNTGRRPTHFHKSVAFRKPFNVEFLIASSAAPVPTPTQWILIITKRRPKVKHARHARANSGVVGR